MNIIYETEQKLKTAISCKEVIDYLEGKGTYIVHSDPRDKWSLHAFDFSIECYNNFAAKNPQFGLDKLFVDEIISKLKSNNCGFCDIYSIFNCITAQLRLEKNNLSSFTIENSKLNEIFQLLREKALAFQTVLKKSKLWKGSDYADGMYGYMQDESNRVYNEVGRRIL